jgi:hypothetical protein
VCRRALLVFSAVAALSGCGERAAAPKPDRVAIQERVAAYARHLLAGDGATACAQLTPRYRRESNERAHLGGVISCAEATSLYGAAVNETMPAGFARQAADPGRVSVTLRGDKAEAALAVGPRVTRARVVRVHGRWLIDGLGLR